MKKTQFEMNLDLRRMEILAKFSATQGINPALEQLKEQLTEKEDPG